MKQPSQARAATKKHVILFLAANPSEASRDPEAMLAWERQTVQRLRTRYPADRDPPA